MSHAAPDMSTQKEPSSALALGDCSASGESRELYQISDKTGRVIYKNLRKSKEGYDWGDGYGHINAYIIKTESWVVTKQTFA